MADFDREEWRKAMRDRRDEWRQTRREHQDQWRQMRREHWRGRHSGFGGLLIGTILAGVGVLLLLQNLGILYFDDVWQYWPAILIVFGVSRAATAYGFGGRIWGGAMALVGALFLLRNMGIIYGNVWNFVWPVVLICVGLAMLVRNLEGHSHWGGGAVSSGAGSSTSNALSISAVFSGARRRIESQEFEGGELHAVFGGIEIDLSKAATKKDELFIEANAVFGGIDLRVPETWSVTMRGDGVFGGYDDKTIHAPSEETVKRPHLIITGGAVFGGVTVKN